jgi:hypothetical protein
MFKRVMLLGAAMVVAIVALVGAQTASADSLKITTNKSTYTVGEQIKFCYTVPSAGHIRIIDETPDGQFKTILEGWDDGYGDCKWATITPPTGYECLRINFYVYDMVYTQKACFTVKHASYSYCTSGQHSAVANQATSMNFVNHTGWTVNVYWLDYSGNAVFYKSLGGWQSFNQSTYVTHPWLLVRSDGHCIGVFYPSSYPTTVDIW